ncbi:MAG TPA: polysaccharide biosynthesis tyrosine autokinase [Terriglobia bacterium]|nr:polysaccharide biosynthesis tyrosine autokinase [Terriglobia bacterium]
MSEDDTWSPSRSTLPQTVKRRSSAVVDLQPGRTDAYADLCTYGKILSKRRWTILTVALLVTTLTAIYSFREKPVYRATVEVEVDSETPGVQSVNNVYQSVPTDSTFLETQVDVLNSGSLAWQTIQQLKLDRNPAFNPSASGGQRPSEDDSQEQKEALISRFENSLQVDLVPGSRMIKVSFESTGPRLAAGVANALVSNYQEYNFLAKYDATRQASGWMREQLDELKAQVEKSQEVLVAYEKEHSIVDISGKENIEDQRLADLSQDQTHAQDDLAEKESLYQLVKANPQNVGLLAQDDLLEGMEAKRADLKTQYVDALRQYGAKFPLVERLQDQISEIQSLIQQEQTRTVERIAHNYQAALGRVNLLAGSVAREKAAVDRLNQLMIQHGLLKHDFDTSQKLYDDLLTKVKDATVSAGLRANNVRLVDHGMAPSTPVRPRKARNIAIGLLVGLILGTSLAFVQDVMDTSIKSTDDVERSIAEPVLGVIPSVRSSGLSKVWYGHETPAAEGNGKVEWAVLKQPTSVLAESYKALRTAVLFSSAPRPPQAVLLTSTHPFEGKTSTAFNLAIGLAQIGKRVLFVDADMRQHSHKRVVNTNGHPGLSSVLTGAGPVEQSLLQLSDPAGFWVLPAGPQSPNPSDLLASQAMQELLATLRGRFDHIVVDTPPVLMVTDASVLSSVVDGVILVAESRVTSRASLARAHRILEGAGANILGCVLNKLDLKYDGQYGSYYCDYVRYYRQGRGGQNPAGARPHDRPPNRAGTRESA